MLLREQGWRDCRGQAPERWNSDAFPHHPGGQPRRDRVPHHAHRQGHGLPHGCGLLRGRRGRAARAPGRCRGLHRAAGGAARAISTLPPSSPPPRRWAPTRCIRATASCPRTPSSRRRAREAGLVFIGPSPAAIAAMGNKAAAKRRMLEAGVPCVPGYQGGDQSDADAGARGRAHRLSRDGQGGGRRRRPRHAAGHGQEGPGRRAGRARAPRRRAPSARAS